MGLWPEQRVTAKTKCEPCLLEACRWWREARPALSTMLSSHVGPPHYSSCYQGPAHPSLDAQLPRQGGSRGPWGCSPGPGLLEVAPPQLWPQSLAATGEAWEAQEGTVALTSPFLWARKGLAAYSTPGLPAPLTAR